MTPNYAPTEPEPHRLIVSSYFDLVMMFYRVLTRNIKYLIDSPTFPGISPFIKLVEIFFFGFFQIKLGGCFCLCSAVLCVVVTVTTTVLHMNRLQVWLAIFQPTDMIIKLVACIPDLKGMCVPRFDPNLYLLCCLFGYWTSSFASSWSWVENFYCKTTFYNSKSFGDIECFRIFQKNFPFSWEFEAAKRKNW